MEDAEELARRLRLFSFYALQSQEKQSNNMLEWVCSLRQDDKKPCVRQQVARDLRSFCNGEYRKVLLYSPIARRILHLSSIPASSGVHSSSQWMRIVDDVKENVKEFLETKEPCPNECETLEDTMLCLSSEEREIAVVVIGSCLLSRHIQLNFTGPPTKRKFWKDLFGCDVDFLVSHHGKDTTLDALCVGGEDVDRLIRTPLFLSLARAVLVDGPGGYKWSTPLGWIWKFRTLFQQQKVLPESVDEIRCAILDSFDSIFNSPPHEFQWWMDVFRTENEYLSQYREKSSPFVGDVLTSLLCEASQIHMEYHDLGQEAQWFLNVAKIVSGVQLRFTGILGKRTKHQTKEIAQLTLCIVQSESSGSALQAKTPPPIVVPEDSSRGDEDRSSSRGIRGDSGCVAESLEEAVEGKKDSECDLASPGLATPNVNDILVGSQGFRRFVKAWIHQRLGSSGDGDSALFSDDEEEYENDPEETSGRKSEEEPLGSHQALGAPRVIALDDDLLLDMPLLRSASSSAPKFDHDGSIGSEDAAPRSLSRASSHESMDSLPESSPVGPTGSSENSSNGNGVVEESGQKEMKAEDWTALDIGEKFSLQTFMVVVTELMYVLSHEARDEVRRERVGAFVERCMRSGAGVNWSLLRATLLFRCKLDIQKRRKIERGVLQYESLFNEMEKEFMMGPSFHRETTDHITVRMDSFWASAASMMYRAQLARTIGLSYLRVGAAATALEWFDRFQMWEERVKCLVVMERQKEAIEVIQKQREEEIEDRGKPSPLTCCLMGDITGDLAHYDEAWEVSEHRFARAKRSKANTLVRQQRYAEAIPDFEDALRLNPIFPSTWFTYGFACMQCAELQKAQRAFVRVVMLEPTDGEAWNNIGSVLLKQGKKKEALSAFSEAARYSFDNWCVWQNVLTVALETMNVKTALVAINRILELRPKEVDENVVGILTRVSQDEWERDPVEAAPLMDAVMRLLGRVTAKVSTNVVVWRCYAQLCKTKGEISKAVEYAQRAVRSACVSGWENDESLLRKVNGELEYLVELYLTVGVSCFRRACLFLNPLVSRARRALESSAEFERMVEIVDRVDPPRSQS